jgi:integrase
MAIKKFYSTKAKAGWKFDARQNKFWSYGFDIYLENGKRKRESGFATRQLAENAVARIKIGEKEKTYKLETRKFPHLSEVLDARLLRIENRRERIRATRIFKTWRVELNEDFPVSELTTAHIQIYIKRRLPEVKAETVNREITVIASALHSAFLDFPELEKWNCPKIPRPKFAKSRRERLITSEETMRILTYLFSPRFASESERDARNRQRVGRVFRFALLTAARIGEITALAWRQIDFSGELVQIIGTKTRFKQTRNVRYLELTGAMREIFHEQREADDFGEYVFSRNGKSVTHYYRHLKKACEAVGVKYGRNARGGLVTHDARHTAITRMLQSGVDLSTVGSITGHSDANLVLHYSHATRESRRKAVEVLDDIDSVWTKKKSQTA